MLLFESASILIIFYLKPHLITKEATVNADGTLSFSEVKGASKTTLNDVKSEFTTNTKYGDYQLNFDNLPDSMKTVFWCWVISTKRRWKLWPSPGRKYLEKL